MVCTLIEFIIAFDYIGCMLSCVHKSDCSQKKIIGNLPESPYVSVSRDVLDRYSMPTAWINTSHLEVDFLWAFIWLNYAHHNAYFAINYSPEL